jgi:acetyltransferase-like isoleucine patch superfamily enzyme
MTTPDPVPPLFSARAAALFFQTPWKGLNEIRRLWLIPWARVYFALVGVRWGQGWRLYGLPIVQKYRPSTMTFGDNLQLRSTVRSNPLGPNHPVILTTRRAGAKLVIGANFGMTGGSICVDEAITIGDRVVVGANTTISDTDFHPLDAVRRQNEPLAGETKLVIIEDDVFIGMNCLILKGVTIGKGSVIGAGSVVTKDIEPGVIAAGNPAKVIRELQGDESFGESKKKQKKKGKGSN